MLHAPETSESMLAVQRRGPSGSVRSSLRRLSRKVCWRGVGGMFQLRFRYIPFLQWRSGLQHVVPRTRLFHQDLWIIPRKSDRQLVCDNSALRTERTSLTTPSAKRNDSPQDSNPYANASEQHLLSYRHACPPPCSWSLTPTVHPARGVFLFTIPRGEARHGSLTGVWTRHLRPRQPPGCETYPAPTVHTPSLIERQLCRHGRHMARGMTI